MVVTSDTTGSFLSRITTLAVGNIAALVIAVLAIPILSRLYSAEEFGVFAMVMAVLAILTPISTLRLDAAVILAGSEESAATLYFTGLVCVVGVAAIAGLMFLAWPTMWLPPELRAWIESPIVLSVVVAVLLFQGYSLMSSHWLLRSGRVRQISTARAGEALVEKAVAIGAGFQVWGVWGLLIGRAAGSVALALQNLRAMRGRRPIPQPRVYWRNHLSPYKGHVMFAPATVAIGEISQWVPVLLAGTTFTSTIAGYFFLSRQLVAMPLNSIGLAIQRILLKEAASDPNGPLVQNHCTRIFVIAVPAVCFISSSLFLIGEPSLDRLLGAGWSGFGRYAAILSIGYCAGFLHLCVSGLFDALQAHPQRILLDVLLLILRVGVFLGAFWLAWSPESAFWAFSLVTFIVYFAGVLQVLYLVGLSRSRIVSLVWRFAALPAVLCGVVVLVASARVLSILEAAVGLIVIVAITGISIGCGLRRQSPAEAGM